MADLHGIGTLLSMSLEIADAFGMRPEDYQNENQMLLQRYQEESMSQMFAYMRDNMPQTQQPPMVEIKRDNDLGF